MDVIDQSADSLPAASIRAEQRLLSAMLVATPENRDQITVMLRASDFHDPFHAWLFNVLRHCRGKDWPAIGMAISEESRINPPVTSGRSVLGEIARMLIDMNGQSVCGQVHRMKPYAGDVKAGSMLRAKQQDLETKLVAVLREADEYVREQRDA